ncbi:hypothetical protein ACROYT_G025598 [Oculina patagonica]
MATRGIASSPPTISSFSPSRNSFSIKNILNLSDETVEKQKWMSKDAAPIDVLDAPCPAPSFLVSPRAVFPPGYHHPHLSSYFPGFCSLPPPQRVAQMTPFILSNHVGSFGVNLQKKRRRPMKKKKLRPLFSAHQIQTMENEFAKCRYVTESRRAELASDLNLTEMQVKTWFQNRRTKWKKETQDNGEA